MGGIPIIKPNYLLDECIPIGAVNGEKRWKSKDGNKIYTWDSLHGEIEVFNKRGYHLGALHPNGDLKKEAIKGRKIYV